MPEISVIIPVYNRPELLREAVMSVLEQSFKKFELIIVDDGSTDNTPSVAAELAAGSQAAGRVRIITTVRIGFPGAARNRGAEAARGRYLAFLDSDDFWQPEKLEHQYSFMSQAAAEDGSAAAALITHTKEWWQRGEKTVSQKGQKHRRKGYIFSDALKKCIIGPSTVMMDRQFYLETGGFHERLEIAEDYEYWLRISSSNEVGYMNEAHTVKRAGDWPQLSEKYGRIEWFRLSALAGLLGIDIPGFDTAAVYLPGYKWSGFSPDAASEALDVLMFKCGVWAAGCRKRGRILEAEQIDAIIEACRTK